jgi:L-serine dehydratase
MFISVLELFKIGIGPSSSHTMGPMIAANDFISRVEKHLADNRNIRNSHICCTLKGSLAFTGKGHNTDRAVTLGLHGYTPEGLANEDVGSLITSLWKEHDIEVGDQRTIQFSRDKDVIFDRSETLPPAP